MRANRLGISWPLLLGAAGFLAVVALGVGLADQDVYLHIAAGRWMLLHDRVPMHDPFSFTMAGAPWVAQEWGAELLTALLYRIAGWSGLVFLGAACFGVTLAYLTRFLLRRMEPLYALLLSCLAAGMMLPYLIDRPHELVWPLTVVWVGSLVRASEENRAPSWWLLGLMLLWVNMHASFILGLGLMVLLAIDSLEMARGERWKSAKDWMPFGVAAFTCALLNPQGYRLLLFPFHLLGIREMLAHFKDWRPPDFQHLQVLDLWLIAVVGAALGGRVRLSLARVVMVLGLLYMALQNNRNVALLGMISPFLLAAPVSAFWKQSPVSGKDANILDRWFRVLAGRASCLSVWLILAVTCVTAFAVLRVRNPQPPGIYTPRAALDVLLLRVQKPRILNDLNFGDYLIFRGVPVFLDARAGMYGEAFLKETFDAMSLAPDGDIEGLLSKYKINAILLWRGLAAVPLLDRLSGWQRVYADRWAVAYVRRRRANVVRVSCKNWSCVAGWQFAQGDVLSM